MSESGATSRLPRDMADSGGAPSAEAPAPAASAAEREPVPSKPPKGRDLQDAPASSSLLRGPAWPAHMAETGMTPGAQFATAVKMEESNRRRGDFPAYEQATQYCKGNVEHVKVVERGALEEDFPLFAAALAQRDRRAQDGFLGQRASGGPGART
eukprot:TRINITY_DN45439_c0_g1_i1.p2 TRINITY_DN45439_c0_g1~~TRINITY_DN45439_c0_g1_i1.p2  ORF type:complete len:169 (+),score=32.81 TRINITY_DN45439_c0_g1_i1:45-509(+)